MPTNVEEIRTHFLTSIQKSSDSLLLGSPGDNTLSGDISPIDQFISIFDRNSGLSSLQNSAFYGISSVVSLASIQASAKGQKDLSHIQKLTKALTYTHSTEGCLGNLLLQRHILSACYPIATGGELKLKESLPSAAELNRLNQSIFAPLAELNKTLSESGNPLLLIQATPLPEGQRIKDLSPEEQTGFFKDPYNRITLLQLSIAEAHEPTDDSHQNRPSALMYNFYTSATPADVTTILSYLRSITATPALQENINRIEALGNIATSLKKFTDVSMFKAETVDYTVMAEAIKNFSYIATPPSTTQVEQTPATQMEQTSSLCAIIGNSCIIS